MSFKPIEEVLTDQTLRLPIRGREWVINPPDALVGMALNARLAASVVIQAGVPLSEEDLAYADQQINIGDDILPDFARQCLNGPNAAGEHTRVYEDMLDAGLTMTEVELATQTAFLAWTMGREVAEHFWNSGGKAGAQTPSRKGLRQTETQTPAAAASTTPTQASPSGTRRKAKAAANKAARSRGSSPTTTTS